MKLQFFYAGEDATRRAYVSVRLIDDTDRPLYATRVVGVGYDIEEAVSDLKNDCSLWLPGVDRVTAMDLCDLFLEDMTEEALDSGIADSAGPEADQPVPAGNVFSMPLEPPLLPVLRTMGVAWPSQA